MRFMSKAALFLLALGALGYMASKSEKPAAKTQATAQPRTPTVEDMVIDCMVKWERLRKNDLRDPDSLEWDDRHASVGIYRDKPALFIAYRAKNGFGGKKIDQAICGIDPDTRKVISVFQ